MSFGSIPRPPTEPTHAQLFKRIGNFLRKVLINEAEHGDNPIFTGWPRKVLVSVEEPQNKCKTSQKDHCTLPNVHIPKVFRITLVKSFQVQFLAYALHQYPFNIPMQEGMPVMEWWNMLANIPHAQILAVHAVPQNTISLTMADILIAPCYQAVLIDPQFHARRTDSLRHYKDQYQPQEQELAYNNCITGADPSVLPSTPSGLSQPTNVTLTVNTDICLFKEPATFSSNASCAFL